MPGDSLGNAGLDGPDGPVDVGVPYDVRFHWDLPAGEAGDIWYGTAALGSSPGSPGDIGSFPVTLHREDDDVTKTASVSTADPGDTVHYDVTVQPNVTPGDLVYTIVDTVPDGLTVDPASVTGGGVVDGQTISWEVPAPSPFLVTGSYVASTPATNPQCATWSGFIDLALPPASIPLNPGLDGDTTAANAFANVGPFELYGQEFPNLVVAEDGLVTVAGGYGGEPWVPQAIPSDDVPNGVLAPLWSDLELSVADGSGMRLATVAALGAAVVQWDNAFEFTGDDSVGPSVGRFQAWIYNTVDDSRPEATFEYGDLGDLPALATIGVEDVLGELATSVVSAGDPGAVLDRGRHDLPRLRRTELRSDHGRVRRHRRRRDAPWHLHQPVGARHRRSLRRAGHDRRRGRGRSGLCPHDHRDRLRDAHRLGRRHLSGWCDVDRSDRGPPRWRAAAPRLDGRGRRRVRAGDVGHGL